LFSLLYFPFCYFPFISLLFLPPIRVICGFTLAFYIFGILIDPLGGQSYNLSAVENSVLYGRLRSTAEGIAVVRLMENRGVLSRSAIRMQIA
jgi:hypothetical protein